MNRKAYRKSQVESALATIGTTPAEHKKAKEGTLAERILLLEVESFAFDAESVARYQAKQEFMAELKGEPKLKDNLQVCRILDAVGTVNAKAMAQASAASYVPTIAEVNTELEGETWKEKGSE